MLFLDLHKSLTVAGYGEVSDHCPMCEHRPFSQDLCKPYKAIRNTAKAFLKTQEKKLADERAKAAAAAEATSVPAAVGNSDLKSADSIREGAVDGGVKAAESARGDTVEKTPDLPVEDQPQPSIEVRAHGSK